MLNVITIQWKSLTRLERLFEMQNLQFSIQFPRLGIQVFKIIGRNYIFTKVVLASISHIMPQLELYSFREMM